MQLRIRSPQDFWAGLLFIAVSVVLLWIGRDYAQGTAVRMGSGYVPRLLCYLLILLGVVVVSRSLALTGPPIGRWALWPLLVIICSVLLFALTLERLGLVVATILLIFVGGLSSRDMRWAENIALALGLAAFAVLVFIMGLKLPIPIWPPF